MQHLSIISGDRMHPAVVQVGNAAFAFCMIPGLVACSRLNHFAVGFVAALGFVAVLEVKCIC